MEQQDHETKHVCKFCNESFSSGRILGGHMRNHLGRNSAKEKVKLETCDVGIDGYGLRANPKKSWKSSGVNHTDTVKFEQNVKCGVCGKQFGSPRSLHGHMRHHSVEERNGLRCKECGKRFRSLRSLTGHMRLHPGNQKLNGESRPNLVSMALSDSDTVSLVRKKRSNRMRYKATDPNSSFSSLNESLNSDFENEQEVEEVALCLILLSRGLVELGGSFEARSFYPNEGNRGIEVGNEVSFGDKLAGKKPRVEILDSCASDSKNQIFECGDCDFHMVCNEEMKVELEVPIESGLLLYDTEIHKGIDESEAGQDCTEEVEFDLQDEFKKRNEFQCRICNKNFATYEALGGHRTFHRTTKSFIGVKTHTSILPETDVTSKLEYMKDAMEEEVNEVSSVSNKSKEHKCHICRKNFVSGQALGGHKRAHIGKAKEEHNTAVKQDNSNIYDAIDRGSNGRVGFESWWDGGSYKHESLVGVMAQAKNVVVSF